MKQVFRLALPSIISNITIPLLGLIDLTIVGHMGDVVYIGAIAIGSMIFNVMYWLFGFLRMGTSGLTSQALGKRDFTEIMRHLFCSLLIGFIIAFTFIIFQTPIRWLALELMQPSPQIAEQATIYFSICIWGAPAMLGLYGMTGWFIGMQNTRVPMVVSIFQNIINIIASLFFVYGFGMKVDGVALGTLIAQWSGFMVAICCWYRYYRRLNRYPWTHKLLKKIDLKRFFKVNTDIFVRTLFLVGVNFFFISAGARQGDIILSVNTLLMTLFTLFSYVMDGFAYAGEALTGKYFGANNKIGFDKVYRSLFAWGAMMALTFTLVYALGGHHFLLLLTNERDVVAAAHDYFWWAVFIPIVGVSAFIYDGIFIGLTETKGMLVSSVISAIAFFIFFISLKQLWGNHALWLAFLVYLALRGFIQWILYRNMIPWSRISSK